MIVALPACDAKTGQDGTDLGRTRWQGGPTDARIQLAHIADMLGTQFPKAKGVLLQAKGDLSAFAAFTKDADARCRAAALELFPLAVRQSDGGRVGAGGVGLLGE